ncbi:putative beta-carotene-binding protein [Schistocerca gregaria]|uniref:putative beta-carotene-binding protein n=1 Tax=Schistocerca gregaria TaxID=7010 RepID=UPI00211E8EE1|nr:putative beta-carotene-binding protein [Schistocerca gregaria]
MGTPNSRPYGQTYVQLPNVSADVGAGAPIVHIKGFFAHFPLLEAAARAFASTVAARFILDTKPSVDKWVAGDALQRAQDVFSTVLYDTFFPGRAPAVVGLYRALLAPSLSAFTYYK